MKPMSVRILILIGCISLLLCGCSSLRRDSEDIRASLLKKTPQGTSHDEVWRYAERKEWNPQRAFDGPDYSLKSQLTNSARTVSTNWITACMGGYSDSSHIHTPLSQCRCVHLPVYVWAYWSFDQHGRLDSVFVRKGLPFKPRPTGL